MTISMINKVKGNRLIQTYRKDYEFLMHKTLDYLNLHQDYMISVIFVNDRFIQNINKQYRNKDMPTDVISFALVDDSLAELEVMEELGDVFINYDAALRQAKEYQHSLRREMCFLFVHGLLHCLGYDHINKEEEKEMFELQTKILDDYISRENDA